MTRLRDTLGMVEKTAFDRWLRNASHTHYGLCGTCKRVRDGEGHPLLVARQSRGRKFQCLSCFDTGGPS